MMIHLDVKVRVNGSDWIILDDRCTLVSHII